MKSGRPRRLISIAHSYAVALNRRLAHEMARVGEGEWEVTAVAPSFLHGDLRPIRVEPVPDERCRLEVVPVHLSRRIHVMVYGGRLRSLLREGWDLVHGWEEPYVFAGAQIALWTPARTPYVFFTAQNLSKRYPPPFNLAERFALRRSAGWVACGQSVADAMLTRGYGSRPHAVIPLGVDTAVFRPDAPAGDAVRARLGWSEPGPPVVGYLGRFVEEKGVRMLTGSLARTTSAWRALFVGGGPLEAELRAWAAPWGDRVRIVTDVPHAEVPAYLNAMDVLCAPSQTVPGWREQFGRMLVEGFASGVPVIASDSGEIPFVVGDAGIIVGERDEDGWVMALERVSGDPDLRAELSRRGIERAHSLYAWPLVARRYLDFFSSICDAPLAAADADPGLPVWTRSGR